MKIESKKFEHQELLPERFSAIIQKMIVSHFDTLDIQQSRKILAIIEHDIGKIHVNTMELLHHSFPSFNGINRLNIICNRYGIGNFNSEGKGSFLEQFNKNIGGMDKDKYQGFIKELTKLITFHGKSDESEIIIKIEELYIQSIEQRENSFCRKGLELIGIISLNQTQIAECKYNLRQDQYSKENIIKNANMIITTYDIVKKCYFDFEQGTLMKDSNL